jgi:hypothetical protein
MPSRKPPAREWRRKQSGNPGGKMIFSTNVRGRNDFRVAFREHRSVPAYKGKIKSVSSGLRNTCYPMLSFGGNQIF